MVATPITKAKRYFRPGIDKMYWLPEAGLVDPSAPTRTELDAAQDVSPDVAATEGFQVTSNQIETPDLATRFNSTIPGRTSAEDSSVTFYQGQDGVDVRSIFTRDLDGFLLLMDGGDVEANLMDVYPVRVSSVGKVRDQENAAQLTVMYSVTAEPFENIDVPAAV